MADNFEKCTLQVLKILESMPCFQPTAQTDIQEAVSSNN